MYGDKSSLQQIYIEHIYWHIYHLNKSNRNKMKADQN